MQIEIQLTPTDQSLLHFDYLYGLHSLLIKTINDFYPAFAKNLHDGIHKERIKLFSFSPLNSNSLELKAVEGEKRKRMLLGSRVWFRIASPWPEFLNTLGESLLRTSQICLNGKGFRITTINMVAPPEFKEKMNWRSFGQSASICTPWTPPDNKYKEYLYPDTMSDQAPSCKELLIANLVHKFQRLQEVREDIASAWLQDYECESIAESAIDLEFHRHSSTQAYRRYSHQGKINHIRSWRCPVTITAPPPIQRLIWAIGLGSQNSQGYGLVQEGEML